MPIADLVLAVDISGEPTEERRDIPNPWECLLNTVLAMGNAITAEKVKHGAPDLIVRPKVSLTPPDDVIEAEIVDESPRDGDESIEPYGRTGTTRLESFLKSRGIGTSIICAC